LSKKAGIQGNVVITVTIGKDGRVEDAKVFKSIPMLDDAALKAAKKCIFKPAKQRDKFVKVKMNIPFNFKLRN
jgi:protein TonB